MRGLTLAGVMVCFMLIHVASAAEGVDITWSWRGMDGTVDCFFIETQHHGLINGNCFIESTIDNYCHIKYSNISSVEVSNCTDWCNNVQYTRWNSDIVVGIDHRGLKCQINSGWGVLFYYVLLIAVHFVVLCGLGLGCIAFFTACNPCCCITVPCMATCSVFCCPVVTIPLVPPSLIVLSLSTVTAGVVIVAKIYGYTQFDYPFDLSSW
ncbi:hypothetical protein J8273_6212 [Carpediemonas membranifera]|uniref:Uncharacterized protein n=1 Tax=Carpediemonas membranifera TaxID=201153 RepID=A0A8J6B790_9EUKA|nr:hypothetical protein J8273_6212 [Carpediemonas membranifera]|eukprot:KAG9391452.1 hypothetical protein J8273_6212 [Carpediemonas membranifera]